MTQETSWKILVMIGLTPWAQGSFFCFLGPCLLATSRNTGWVDIHEFLRTWTQEALGYTGSCLGRLFYALQTRRDGGLRSRSASCFQTVVTVAFIIKDHNARIIFSWPLKVKTKYFFILGHHQLRCLEKSSWSD